MFFFQAEDGIRDTSVTGVQTCALPILGKPEPIGPVVPVVTSFELLHRLLKRCNHGNYRANGLRLSPVRISATLSHDRSEERRVGKECRAAGWRVHEENKTSDASTNHKS